tara:strand:- start:1363 stop:1647 length:285 start_codon:yes stop_codon:yes gene_type:complete
MFQSRSLMYRSMFCCLVSAAAVAIPAQTTWHVYPSGFNARTIVNHAAPKWSSSCVSGLASLRALARGLHIESSSSRQVQLVLRHPVPGEQRCGS